MRSATAEPHVRAEAEALSAPETALVQYDAASGQDNEEEEEEGGYRLTFNTSSVCFAGTGAQVDTYMYNISSIYMHRCKTSCCSTMLHIEQQ